MELNVQEALFASHNESGVTIINGTGIYQFVPNQHQVNSPFWPIYKAKHTDLYILWHFKIGWFIGPKEGLEKNVYYLKSKSNHYNYILS